MQLLIKKETNLLIIISSDKVVCVKVVKNDVLLEVEEELDGRVLHYEVDCENGMVPL
jgi:hypothetical protein